MSQEKLDEIFNNINDDKKSKDLNSDATNVTILLKAAKVIVEDLTGKEASVNDVISVYSLLKSESLTRITEEMLKAGRRAPGGIELMPLNLGGGNGNGFS